MKNFFHFGKEYSRINIPTVNSETIVLRDKQTNILKFVLTDWVNRSTNQKIVKVKVKVTDENLLFWIKFR